MSESPKPRRLGTAGISTSCSIGSGKAKRKPAIVELQRAYDKAVNLFREPHSKLGAFWFVLTLWPRVIIFAIGVAIDGERRR